MSESTTDPNRERPGSTDALDWRAGRTWVLLGATSLCFGGLAALCCVALEGFVYLLFAAEPAEGRNFVTLLLGGCLAIAAAYIPERIKIRKPGFKPSDTPDHQLHHDRNSWPRNTRDTVLQFFWCLAFGVSAWGGTEVAKALFASGFFSGASLYPLILLVIACFDLPYWIIVRRPPDKTRADCD